MDIDAAPCDAASQCPSSVMMLQESAKNLAFDILTPISGSNATTPRDAIRAGTRALESTSCAGLTPDDRGRPAARQARRCSEVSRWLPLWACEACPILISGPQAGLF